MRVTNKMLANNYMVYLRNNLENMQTLQEQQATGKQINKPSDDPFKAARIMQLNTDLNVNAQYKSNISDASDFLSTTDSTLGQIESIFERVSDLLSSTGNITYGDSQRQSIKDEITEHIGQLSQLLNTSFDGTYIFAGTRGANKPTGVVKDGNGNDTLVYLDKSGGTITNMASTDIQNIQKNLSTNISEGVTVEYSVSAYNIDQYGPAPSSLTKPTCLRDLLTNIMNNLSGKNGDGTTPGVGDDPYKCLITGDLQGIKDAESNILSMRSLVGARETAMKNASARNDTQNFNLTKVLSSNEDVDIAQNTMESNEMQTVYLASLQISGKILQPTLLDYLR